MNSVQGDRVLPRPSFLIRKSPDQRSFASFPELIAGYHVLHRFSMPRHPPYTLKSLTTFIDHRHTGRGVTSRCEVTADARKDTPPEHHTYTIHNGPQSPKRCSTTPTRQKDQNGWEVAVFCRVLGGHDKNFEPHHSLVKEQTEHRSKDPFDFRLSTLSLRVFARFGPAKYGRVSSRGSKLVQTRR